MHTLIKKTKKVKPNANILYLLKAAAELDNIPLEKKEREYVASQFEKTERTTFYFNRLTHWLVVCLMRDDSKGNEFKTLETLRKAGDKTASFLNESKEEEVTLHEGSMENAYVLAFAEGMALGNYQFNKYRPSAKSNSLKTIYIFGESLTPGQVNELNHLVEACYHCRDLVNEPYGNLDAVQFADFVAKMSRSVGIKAEVLNKSRITALKMEGLLAVNRGSKTHPSFTVLEWKPEGAKNVKPIVLVGKGVVFDTGGLSLKPPSGMETMKQDMAGAATVFATLYALAKNKVPLHVVGLLPATDNRPGDLAVAPGDVIRMVNGKTVEVVNTDAEGRLIMADALIYAERFEPELAIDVATLTGSATAAIGKHGMAGMHQDAENDMALLKDSGWAVYERIAEFPFWEEYGKDIESDVADIKNISGTRSGGVITAGKFLSHFISYPWIHLDIAGVAFMDGRESYRGKGASGMGTRLLYHFISRKAGG